MWVDTFHIHATCINWIAYHIHCDISLTIEYMLSCNTFVYLYPYGSHWIPIIPMQIIISRITSSGITVKGRKKSGAWKVRKKQKGLKTHTHTKIR